MQPPFEDRCGIQLSRLLPDKCVGDAPNLRVTACSNDASQCQPGDLFVAVVSTDRDGHMEAQEAVRRGAVAVVAEHMLPISVPTYVVDDTREVYGHVCQNLVGHPSGRLRTFGVTGTNGKTTTSTLLASVLRAASQNVAFSTTIGRYDGVEPVVAKRTTPHAAELANWLARSEANGCTHAIVEASSVALAERRMAGVELDGAILTNIRRDHLDFHGTTRNYRQAKTRVFDHLKAHGFAVLNADDPASEALTTQLSCPLITFGRRQPADVTAHVVERFQGEQTFLLSAGSETVPVRTRMIGDHHVSNCLAVAAAGLVMGLPLTTIARGLEAVDHISNRLDRVECGQDFGVYVDCADTPDRLAVALRAVRQVTQGRLICLISGAVDNRRSERPMLGRVAERSADVGIITNRDAAGHVDSSEIAHDILDGWDRPARAHIIPTRTSAIRCALEQAKRGDSVLIAATTGRSSGFNAKGTSASSDFEYARRWLSESADCPTLVASQW
jgi:UDP-N-acetylmuramoyl-L-alanyl-D-glutamate--2,6-diaminopimelate ligase